MSSSGTTADNIKTTTTENNDGIINTKRAFRTFASSLIVAVRQAELVASASSSVGVVDTSSSSGEITTTREKSDVANNPAEDRLNEALGVVGRQRLSLRKHVTFLEGKLRGNVKESEALNCCLRSTPCVVSGRKRKFLLLNTAHDEGGKNLKSS
jgi:hypothetical protein